MVNFRFSLFVIVQLTMLLILPAFFKYQHAPHFDVKSEAISKTIEAQNIIGDRLVGPEFTLITTTLGAAEAKRLSLHPDFSAVITCWLIDAGLKAGDKVAVNFSGSFPALNIATLAAIHSLRLEPIIISSVGASTWGATDPSYTWLDIEQSLVEAGLWNWKSTAASLGGVADRGRGLFPEGIELAREAIRRNKLVELQPNSVNDAIDQRLTIYRSASGTLPSALVNVGGNHVIFGEKGHALPLRQGLTFGYHPELSGGQGLSLPFFTANRPVIHIINIRELAAEYGISANTPIGTSRVLLKPYLTLPLRIGVWLWIIASICILYLGNRRAWWPRGPII